MAAYSSVLQELDLIGDRDAGYLNAQIFKRPPDTRCLWRLQLNTVNVREVKKLKSLKMSK